MSPVDSTSNSPLKRSKRVFLFSGPRTASNLLTRLLSKQENFVQSENYFFSCKTAINQDIDAHPNTHVPEELRNRARKDVQNAFNKLQKIVEQTQIEGKLPFVKEHVVMASNPSLDNPISYPCDPSFWTPLMLGDTEPRPSTNPTVLPDAFLEKWSAIFLIRHPAPVIPSLLRTLAKFGTGMEGAMLERSLSVDSHPQRKLYDWFVAHHSQEEDGPTIVVIDADDVMHNRLVIKRLCDIVGMYANTVQYEWEAKTGEEMGQLHPIDKIFLSTLIVSHGVVEGKDSGSLDLVAEKEKWAAEFGEDLAKLLTSGVENATGEYEYLSKRRLKGGLIW